MTEELKFIVNAVNASLKTEYNLISFDSMPGESLMQVLVDVLSHFNATHKVEVKFTDREECVRILLEGLKKIQYRIETEKIDPYSFRESLSKGDKKIIYPIFKYIFLNKEKIKHVTYLAKFLLPIQLPPEAMANPEVASIWDEYLNSMENFKLSHKAFTEASQEIGQLKELRNDANAIDIEKENVNKRIERTQTRLDKVPQHELLLESSFVLRSERDRQRELKSHLDEQNHELTRLKSVQGRLQKDLSNARMATQSTSAQFLMESIQEETQVMEFLVKQKLPKELNNKMNEIKLLEVVVQNPNISDNYLHDLKNDLNNLSEEIQTQVEKRLQNRGNQNDTLVSFRQQAATITRNKEMAAEQLNEISKELRSIDINLQRKQSQLAELVGDVVLRGEDLKQYVNTLKAKSNVFKQHRSELAKVKAEVADLTQTLDNLKSQDPSLSITLEQVNQTSDTEKSLTIRPESPIEARGLTELSRLVEGLKRAVNSSRDRITPISQQLRPIRDRIVELKDTRDSKMQAFNSVRTTLATEASALESEIQMNEKTIKRLEFEWQELKMEHDRLEKLLECVNDIENTDGKRLDRKSLKESLLDQINEKEKEFKHLQEQNINILSKSDFRAKQFHMWNEVKCLLQVKLETLKEARNQGPGGTLSIQQNSETFTLQ